MMPHLAPAPAPTTTTIAERQAAALWAANARALQQAQPAVAALLGNAMPDLTWTFGRDGQLTARHADGRWWADCSVPLAAGRALLRSLEADALNSCLLAPAHAGVLIAARERAGTCPAMLVVQPDAVTCAVILSCVDVAAALLARRLWFITGPEWAGLLRQTFDEHPGLATPARFIRTRLSADAAIEDLTVTAQAVFSAVLTERSAVLQSTAQRSGVARDERRMLLIGGNATGTLWHDAADVLHDQIRALTPGSGRTATSFDPSDPLSSSPLALLRAAEGCGSVVTADVNRADANDLVSRDVPWISWVTRPVIPPFASAGARDGLVLTDPAYRATARASGWPDARVRVAAWPKIPLPRDGSVGSATLALLTDTRALIMPAAIEVFSSHRLLWEFIEAELREHPLVVGTDVGAYLAERACRLGIDCDRLDRGRMVTDLIVPAHEQAVARLLVTAGLPLTVWGRGWEAVADVRRVCGGPITDREHLGRVIAGSAATVHCWPSSAAHPLHAYDRPVLHPRGDPALLVRDARALLRQTPQPRRAEPAGNATPASAVLELLLNDPR